MDSEIDLDQLQRDLDALIDQAAAVVNDEVAALNALRGVLAERIESSRAFLDALGHLVERAPPPGREARSFERLAHQLQQAVGTRAVDF